MAAVLALKLDWMTTNNAHMDTLYQVAQKKS